MLKNLANTYLSSEDYEILPMLNDKLERWLTLDLPSDFGGYFKLSDLVIQVHDGYLFFGATPVFIPPVSQDTQGEAAFD